MYIMYEYLAMKLVTMHTGSVGPWAEGLDLLTAAMQMTLMRAVRRTRPVEL